RASRRNTPRFCASLPASKSCPKKWRKRKNRKSRRRKASRLPSRKQPLRPRQQPPGKSSRSAWHQGKPLQRLRRNRNPKRNRKKSKQNRIPSLALVLGAPRNGRVARSLIWKLGCPVLLWLNGGAFDLITARWSNALD